MMVSKAMADEVMVMEMLMVTEARVKTAMVAEVMVVTEVMMVRWTTNCYVQTLGTMVSES